MTTVIAPRWPRSRRQRTVAGSRGATSYPVMWVRGTEVVLVAQGESELLFMPRPSPHGERWLIMGRAFVPQLDELVP